MWPHLDWAPYLKQQQINSITCLRGIVCCLVWKSIAPWKWTGEKLAACFSVLHAQWARCFTHRPFIHLIYMSCLRVCFARMKYEWRKSAMREQKHVEACHMCALKLICVCCSIPERQQRRPGGRPGWPRTPSTVHRVCRTRGALCSPYTCRQRDTFKRFHLCFRLVHFFSYIINNTKGKVDMINNGLRVWAWEWWKHLKSVELYSSYSVHIY